MPDEADPPRKFYQLKPKEFERVNAIGPTPAPAPGQPANPLPAPTGADAPRAAGPIDVRELVRQGAAGAPLLTGNQPRIAPNDVHAMLRENLAQANAAGLNDLAPKPKRKSRRKRDYWLIMVPVNAFFAFWAFGPSASPVTFVYGLGGMAFFSAGMTWVMWFVMDDY